MEEVKDRILCSVPFFSPPARNNGTPVLFCLTGVSSSMYLSLMEAKSWGGKCLLATISQSLCTFTEGKKASFLSTRFCCFSKFLNMLSECNQHRYSLGSTQVWRGGEKRKIMLFNPSSVPVKITRRWGQVTFFCSVCFPEVLTTILMVVPALRDCRVREVPVYGYSSYWVRLFICIFLNENWVFGRAGSL